MLTLSVYLGLFLSALAAASLLPLQSEAVLVALLLGGQQSVVGLIAVASLGNVLGSLLNWWLGRSLERFRHARWFPVSERRLLRAQRGYARYGRWSLLLSWMPVIGDPLTLVAGVMRERLWVFLALVSLAKTARYAVLAWLTLCTANTCAS
jgi:membrane protein YqaA with SNARE-associated domain